MWQKAISAGGVNAEFITPEYSNSNKTISCSWDYDAECVIVISITSNTKYIMMYDLNSNYWVSSSSSSSNWHSGGVDASATITARSFEKTISSAFSDAVVLPITNKPTGYFT